MSLITVSGLRKSSGASEILRGIDLDVDQGEIVGVLGPNGAGKSTAIECIGGLRRRDGGTVRVDGMTSATTGGAAGWEPFAVLIAWTIGAALVASATFRWE